MASKDEAVEDAKKTLKAYAFEWGKSPLPPTLLATVITALHARPFQPLPMIFPPILLFSTYLNLNGYEADSAGITAAWSGLYIILARRRRMAALGLRGRLVSKFGARGLTRGAAITLAAANVVAGGMTYAFEKRSDSEESP